MFNDRYGLTQAVIEGRKTMTRRIVDPKSKYEELRFVQPCIEMEFGLYGYTENDEWNIVQPRYKVGETAAVAQNYNEVVREFTSLAFEPGSTNKMFVRAELMPHQIRITGIKYERLQDISDADCLKEGINASNSHEIGYGIPWVYEFAGSKMVYYTPREAFAALIDKVLGKGTWECNPWVVAYEFKLVK